jgi:hypothetical protein
MPSPTIEKLLILQDRDTRRLGVESQMKAVPREIASVEQRIAAEKAAIDAAKGELREFESKKKILETEIGSAETQRGKYQTQQMTVKKNDEYQALGAEIEHVRQQIGELEGRELEVMYAVDEAKKRFAAAEASAKQSIAGHEGRIRTLREREKSLESELREAQAAVTETRAGVSAAGLEAYDQAARRRMPAVVPIRGSKCGGCHLKVSSEVESAARGKNTNSEFVNCDQCGQLVYWES